jgi:nucleotide-binding universal stress UspA family protein
VIKDIVFSLGMGKLESPAEKYAISMAAALEAHIAGVTFAYDPIELMSQLSYMGGSLIEKELPDWRGEANAALDRFSKAAVRSAISSERLILPADLTGVGDQFGRIARHFDLSVVAQPEAEGAAVESMIVEGALFESGRPVIVVPYIQTALFKLGRVMICWDGSRPAARAIADAMPLLALAERTEVVIVADEHDEEDDLHGVGVGQHLARHGLDVNINRIIRGKIDVADALLSHVADSGVHLIVMGGYGHTRLREFILGGVTRSMLRSMTVPVLMSH